MGVVVSEMLVNVKAETRPLTSGLTSAQNAVRSAAQNMGGAASGMTSAFNGAASASKGLGGALGGVASVMGGMLGANLIGNIASGFMSLGQQALGAVASYERLGLAIQSMVAQEIRSASGTTKAIITGQQRIDLTEEESKQLRDLTINRQQLALSIQQNEADYASYVKGQGAGSLAAQKESLAIQEQRNQLADLDQEIAALNARNGVYVNTTKLVKEGVMSQAEALAIAGPKAKELIAWTEKLGIESPFTQADVAQSFKLAMAYGFTTDESKRLTAALVDMGSRKDLTGDTLRSITVSLGQMRTSGKMTGMEMRELSVAGVPVVQMLASAFGVTEQAMADMLDRGAVPAKKGIEALVGEMEDLYKGGGKDAAGTFTGLLSSLSDIKGIGLREFFTDTFEAIKPSMQSFVDQFQKGDTRSKIQGLGAQIGGVVAGIIANMKSIAPVAGAAGLGILAAVNAPLAAVIGIIGAVALAWKGNWLDIQGKTASAVGAIKQIIGGLQAGPLGQLVSQLGGTFRMLNDPSFSTKDKLKMLSDDVLAWSTLTFRGVPERIGNALSGIATTIRRSLTLDNVKSTFERIGTTLSTTVGSWPLTQAIAGKLGEVHKALDDTPIGPVIDTIGTKFGELATAAGKGLEGARSWLAEKVPEIKKWLVEGWPIWLDARKKDWESFSGAVETGLKDAQRWLETSGVKKAMADLAQDIKIKITWAAEELEKAPVIGPIIKGLTDQAQVLISWAFDTKKPKVPDEWLSGLASPEAVKVIAPSPNAEARSGAASDEAIKAPGKTGPQQVGDTLLQTWNDIKGVLDDVGDKIGVIVGKVQEAWKSTEEWRGFLGSVATDLGKVKDIFLTIGQIIDLSIIVGLKTIGEKIGEHTEGISEKLSPIGSGLATFKDTFIKDSLSLANSIAIGIGSALQGVLDGLTAIRNQLLGMLGIKPPEPKPAGQAPTGGVAPQQPTGPILPVIGPGGQTTYPQPAEYASGVEGIASRRTHIVVGERGPEAVKITPMNGTAASADYGPAAFVAAAARRLASAVEAGTGGQQINLTVNNPVGVPTEQSVTRELMFLGALGILRPIPKEAFQ